MENNKNVSKKQRIGRIGEDVACTFLVKHDFEIVTRNYLKRCGEIDVIAKKSGVLHFVEVKTISSKQSDVTHETEFRPEENVHFWKTRRISRTIQTYFLEKVGESGVVPEWQFDIIAVFLDTKQRKARCRFSENIIL